MISSMLRGSGTRASFLRGREGEEDASWQGATPQHRGFLLDLFGDREGYALIPANQEHDADPALLALAVACNLCPLTTPW